MLFTRSKAVAISVAALSALSVVAFARQIHGVGELDCAPVVAAGSLTPLSLTATGPNTGAVTIFSYPVGVVNWSGTPSWDSNNKATVNVNVSSSYIGLVLITATANGQSASVSTSTIILPD